ncbi:hypothetical protein GCM10028805_14630 [Spirosoma harenae]
MTPLSQEIQPDADLNPIQANHQSDSKPGKKEKKEKKKKVSKGVETLFRTTMSNHMRLSEMADRKANLMISINTIVISITLSAFTRSVDIPSSFIVPSLLLVGVSLVTIVVSLIATNPTISPILRKPPKSATPPVDLLFFGYYSRLTADEYRTDLRKLLTQDDDLYNSLIDNIYAQGQVLARKYRLLKFAYQFFMIGFSTVVVIAAITLVRMR